jgi:hypothetical protein
MEEALLSRQLDQVERRETLRQDVSVQRQQREQQTGTYLSHTHSDLGGRYAIVSPQIVVGAEATINYPACSPALAVQLPDEPPLSAWDNPALEPLEVSSCTQGQLPNPASPSASLGVDGAGLGLSPEMVAQRTLMASSSSERDDVSSGVGRLPTGDPAGSQFANPPVRSIPNVAGSPPLRRRRL